MKKIYFLFLLAFFSWKISITAATVTLNTSTSNVNAGNICQSVTDTIFRFTLISSGSGTIPVIDSIKFKTTGTYLASDIDSIKLWYKVNSGPATIYRRIKNSTAASSYNFAGLNYNLNSGSTYLFWLTADVSATAVNDDSIIVSQLSTSDIIFKSGTLPTFSGSAKVGGTKKFKSLPTVTIGSALSAICQSGTTASLGGGFGGGATAAVWSASPNTGSFANNTGATPNSATYTASSNSSSPITLTLTSSGGSCGTATNNKTLIVNQNPTITIGSALSAICQGGTTVSLGGTFGGGATAAVWTANPNIGSFSNNSGSSPNTATYTAASNSTSPVQLILTTSGGSCGAAQLSKSLSVNQVPIMTSATTANVCSGTALKFPLTANMSANFLWVASNNTSTTGESLSNQSTDTIKNTILNNSLIAQLVNYTVTPTSTVNSCAGNSQTVTITVNPKPNMTSATSTSVCSGTALNFPFTTDVSSNLIWLANDNANTSGESLTNQISATINNTITNTSITAQQVSYSVTPTATLGSCVGNAQTVTVTVNPKPAMTSTSAVSICNGVTLNISLTADVSSNFTWIAANNSNVNGESTSSQTTSTISNSLSLTNGTTSDQVVVYTVTPTSISGNCLGSSQTVNVTVGNAPSFTSPRDTTECLGGDATLVVSITGAPGTTFQWRQKSTCNSTCQNGCSVDDIASATNSSYTPSTTIIGIKYYWARFNTPGTTCNNFNSNCAQVTVVADPTITVNPAPTTNECIGGTEVLTVSASGGTGTFTYQWQSSTISGCIPANFSNITGAANSTYTPPSAIAGTTYYRCLISQSGSGCTPTPLVSNCATVTIVATPIISTDPLDISECLGGNASLTAAASGGTGIFSYQWQSATSPGCNSGLSTIAAATSSSFTPPTLTVGTMYYKCLISQSGSGCTVSPLVSNCAAVTTVADPIITTQPVDITECTGGTGSLSVSVSGGSGTFSYQWQSSSSAGCSAGFTNINGANSNNYTPTAIAGGTTYYRCIINQTGTGCNVLTSTCAKVIVVAGPVITTQPIAINECIGGSDTLKISVSGGTGSFSYQWQSSVISDCVSGFTNINGATSNFYKPSSAVADTLYFRCIVSQSGTGCNSITSSCVSVIIKADPTITSQPTPIQTLCKDGIPTDLNVIASGGSGIFSYTWQVSSNANCTAGMADIIGATSSIYTPPTNTPDTLFYHCIINQSGSGCTPSPLVSNCSMITVVSDPSITVQPISTQTLCKDGTPTILSVSVAGGTGSFSYQWQVTSNSDCITGMANVQSATSATYTPPTNNPSTLYYRCIISQSGVGCDQLITSCAVVAIVTDPTITVQPYLTQTLCKDGTPTDLSVTVAGGTGTFSYQWQVSNSDCISGMSNISGANTATFTPPTNLPSTLYYRCMITQSGVGCDQLISLCATVTVVADPLITVQPTASQILCKDGTPTDLSVSATGGTGTFSYQWQVTSNSDCSTGMTNVFGATNASFTPPTNLADTLYYRCVISQTGVGCNQLTSSCAIVSVVADPTISSQPIASQTLCKDGVPTNLSVVVNGGTGAFSYQWQSTSNLDCTTGMVNILGATSSSYTPPSNVPSTSYYRCIISQTGVGCDQLISSCAAVSVVGDPTITTQPNPFQKLCANDAPNSLTVAVSGGTGAFSYTWQVSDISCTNGFTTIPGSSTSSYLPSTLPALLPLHTFTKYYRCIITQNGVGCDTLISSCAQILVNSVPKVISSLTDTICSGTLLNYSIEPSFHDAALQSVWLTPNPSPLNIQNNKSDSITSVITAVIPDSLVNTSFIQAYRVPYMLILNYTNSGKTCSSNDSLWITVNPSPPLPQVSDYGKFPSGFGYDSAYAVKICGGSDFISYNITNSSPGFKYFWSINAPSKIYSDTTFSSVDNVNALASFVYDATNNGKATIKVYTRNGIAVGGCNSAENKIDVAVSANDEISEADIISMEPGHLLVYLDNTLDGYAWGYDQTVSHKPNFISGQYYQALVPSGNSIPFVDGNIDTTTYDYWVMVYKKVGAETCRSRVYYDGLHSHNRFSQAAAISDDISTVILPNPNNGIFELLISGNLYGPIEASVFNNLGQRVAIKNFEKHDGAEKFGMNLSPLPQGIYMLELVGSNNEHIFTKLLIHN